MILLTVLLAGQFKRQEGVMGASFLTCSNSLAQEGGKEGSERCLRLAKPLRKVLDATSLPLVLIPAGAGSAAADSSLSPSSSLRKVSSVVSSMVGRSIGPTSSTRNTKRRTVLPESHQSTVSYNCSLCNWPRICHGSDEPQPSWVSYHWSSVRSSSLSHV